MDTMTNTLTKVKELKAQGFCCAPITLAIGMQKLNLQDPNLIKAMNGFCGGMSTGNVCGALTGAIALFGLYCGKSDPQTEEDKRVRTMTKNQIQQFQQQFGALTCSDLVHDDPGQKKLLCDALMTWSIENAWQQLQKEGFTLTPQ